MVRWAVLASKVAGINSALRNRRGGNDDGYLRDNKSWELVADLEEL